MKVAHTADIINAYSTANCRNRKKCLTKQKKCDKIKKLSVKRRHIGSGTQKNLKKDLKKVLTNEKECDIINKLSRKREQLRTLKIEQ